MTAGTSRKRRRATAHWNFDRLGAGTGSLPGFRNTHVVDAHWPTACRTNASDPKNPMPTGRSVSGGSTSRSAFPFRERQLTIEAGHQDMKPTANLTTQHPWILLHVLTSRSMTSTAARFDRARRLPAELRRKLGDPPVPAGCPAEPSDPRKFEGRCNLGFTDSNMVVLIPPVVTAIRRASPFAETRIRSVVPESDVLHALPNRDLELIAD